MENAIERVLGHKAVVDKYGDRLPQIKAKLLEAHKLAKQACPSVRLAMLLAAWRPSVGRMRDFVPYSDVWIFWKNGSKPAKNSPVHGSFVRSEKFCNLQETDIHRGG
jgi:hypothetical protein